MAELKLPLSGNVSQLISPWTAWFSALGSQIGLVNIHLGEFKRSGSRARYPE